MKSLFRLAAVVETGVALALLVDPSSVTWILLGSELNAPGEVVGRIAGGGLLSLGVACWRSRNTPSAPASLGVAWGLLAYNIVACVTLAWAGAAMTTGRFPALSLSLLHGLFGAALLGALRRQV